MVNFAQQRQAMVDGQVRVNDVTDQRILAAMQELPREQFVPRERMELAYIDEDLLLRKAKGDLPARYLIEPMVISKLVQALELRAADHVLDIGCSTGYSSALLGQLAASVVALEEDPDFAATATRLLKGLGATNVKVVRGALAAGWPEGAPYDAILLEGSAELIPQALTDQLKDGGRLVAVMGTGRSAKATVHLRSGEVVSARPVFDAAIPMLPGFARTPQFVF